MKLKSLSITILLSLLFAPTLLAQDTDDPATNYKAALALVDAGKGTEGIPLLEKVLKTQSAYTDAAYSLLGGIYDKNNQPEKAIAIYNDGLKAYPKDQNLYFNLGIADFRAKKYNDAELAAIEAIKLDPKHANSQRLYGLVTFHQNKRLNALMAFCSFLLIEPNGPRSDEAITNLQSILKGGVLKADGAVKTLPADAKETAAFNAIISSAIAAGRAKKLTGNALLEFQLKTIFSQTGQASARKTDRSFFDKFYADYFFKLAQSGNVPALAKLITTKTQDAALMDWVKNTERAF
ncbi:tetratricopeptide repeat protein [Mucilaginibacter sp. UR6-11]|uniref:tetratricopeptide repeat protein n=1 Tax=Mucilaginibacter sp. UR6-11 TaxID=1435644 RepID=UPI001E2DEC7D|nr:tetratricopeptide repeat protein [Mucilaginibacter sp. UR6-11]MCC8426794.1 tetratricopeptide repeat protein [Mucilaginibacter sp. UR6-11]